MDDISAFARVHQNTSQVAENREGKGVKKIVGHQSPFNGVEKVAGPSRRFKDSYKNKDVKSMLLSKKAKRRLRQKIKRQDTKINANVLEREIQLLKSMKRLESDVVTVKEAEAILSGNTTNTETLRRKTNARVKTLEQNKTNDILGGHDVPLIERAAATMFTESNGICDPTEQDNLNEEEDSSNALAQANGRGPSVSNSAIDGKGFIKSSSSKPVRTKTLPLKKVEGSEIMCEPECEKGSVEFGKECFQWMISPKKVHKFMAHSWEKKPLYIQRETRDYYKNVFSCKAFDTLLRNSEKPLIFGKNLDVTSYTEKDGRETHTPDGGRAYASVVWDYFSNGCSIRIINPQTFSDPVWKLCSTLQDYFGSMVGANVYLTPPGTQGFAPHWDDVDAFILQLEGKKHWRIYELRDEEKLPRFSSKNLTQDEIGDPCLEATLEAGDMLYMPRGAIHQGYCLEDIHSLHITISCHQRHTYGDLLQKVFASAISSAMQNEVDFRKGLPLDILGFMGTSTSSTSSNSDSIKRKNFIGHVSKLMSRVLTHAAIDSGVDQMGKTFIHDSLPPYLTASESNRSVENGGERWHTGKAKVVNRVEINPDTEVRFIRARCVRLIREASGCTKLYYNVANTREYHEIGLEPNFLEIDDATVPAIEILIQSYPKYVTVEALPFQDLDQKMRVAQDLWERKLLMTREVLDAFKFDD